MYIITQKCIHVKVNVCILIHKNRPWVDACRVLLAPQTGALNPQIADYLARVIAHTTSHPPTPTSARHKQSSNQEKGSSDRHSNIGACNTAGSPPKHQSQTRPKLRKPTPRVVPNVLTTDSLAIRVERKLNSKLVLETLADLFVEHGSPDHIRSDNGPEFIATALREWLGRLDVKTLYIAPGSPWENGYCEIFNSKLRDEFLDREVLYTLKEAQVLIEAWRWHYNTVRPHSSLGYRPPAPETLLPAPLMPPYVEGVSA